MGLMIRYWVATGQACLKSPHTEALDISMPAPPQAAVEKPRHVSAFQLSHLNGAVIPARRLPQVCTGSGWVQKSRVKALSWGGLHRPQGLGRDGVM